LGSSKFGGKAHFPENFACPSSHALIAQICLGDVKTLDPFDVLPNTGYLYFFSDLDHKSNLLLYASNGADALRVFHSDKSLNSEYPEFPLSFNPNFYFDPGCSDIFAVVDLIKALPKKLISGINKLIGNSNKTLPKPNGDRFFGKPTDYQSKGLEDAIGDNLLLQFNDGGDGNYLIAMDMNKLRKADFSEVEYFWIGT